MTFDLNTKTGRKALADYCESEHEINRRINNFKDWDIYNGNIQPYVATRLSKFFGKDCTDYPEISCINVAKKITEASTKVYRTPPKRNYVGLSDDQMEIMDKIYRDTCADRVFKYTSRVFKYDDIAHMGVFVRDGEFEIKFYKSHELIVLHSMKDNSPYEIYVLPHQMKEGYDAAQSSDKMKYTVWSTDMHFIMDGTGEIKEEFTQLLAPRGVTPFIAVSDVKNMGYWPETKNPDGEFTIQLNQAFSEYNHVVRVQGIAYGVLKLDQKQAKSIRKSDNIRVGVNKLLILEAKEGEVDPNLDFISPSPDLAGMREFIEGLINVYLTSKGLDGKNVVSLSGQTASFTSGFERLLAQVSEYEESADQIDIFKKAEMEVFSRILDWQAVLAQTNGLSSELQLGSFGDEAGLEVVFKKPEIIKSEKEMLETISAKEQAGYISRVMAIMKLFGVSREQAIEHLQMIERDNREVSIATEDTGLQEDNPS